MPLLKPSNALDLKLWKDFSGLILSSPHQELEVREMSQMSDSPFDKLPHELLREIFDYYFEEEIPSCIIEEKQQLTMTLSQDMSTPAAQTRFDYGRKGLNRKKKRAFTSSIEHVARWKAVQIWTEYCSEEDLLSLRDKSAPQLELLFVHGKHLLFKSRRTIADALFSLLATSSPSLELCVHITDLCLPTYGVIDLWSRLEFITLIDLRPALVDDCITCLSLCTSAKSITLTSDAELTMPYNMHEIALLPHLLSLTLGLFMDPGIFLQYFRLPNLKFLSISRSEGPYDYDALDRFHAQSNFSLNTYYYSVSDDSTGVDDVIGFFELPWIHHIPYVSLVIDGKSIEVLSEFFWRLDTIPPAVRQKLRIEDNEVGWENLIILLAYNALCPWNLGKDKVEDNVIERGKID
ncbi:hypothetical protein BDQ17DRAFT_1425787 [Cyathus striatus]|nr:hypothetical protein BDQ17DRAFT_1425787 [Cyathus striatus]